MKKPTILIIGPTPPPYMGPSVATKMILESELNQRFRLVHMDTSDRRSVANIGRIDFTNVYLVFLHIFKLFVLLCIHSPSVVYLPISQTVIGYFRDVIFMLLAKFFSAKIVIHLRGGYFRQLYETSNDFVKFVIKVSCKMVCRAIVLDDSLRYIFKDLVQNDHIVVVSNGIDEGYISSSLFNETYSARNKKIQEYKHKKMKILFLSNLILTKGYFDAIKSLKKVVNHTKDFELILAGDFYEGNEVKNSVLEYVDQNRLKPFVKFVGIAVDKEKKELLLAADIFVFPTYYHAEGQPWVLIEAMAAGLPIISTNQGSIKAMVIDGKNGYLVEKQNPIQLAEKIILLIKDDETRSRMSMESRKQFLKHYTMKEFINSLAEVFNSVLPAVQPVKAIATIIHKPTIVIIGPVPPPYHGVTIITKLILNSRIKDKYDMLHHDTSDHRNIKNIGKIDFQNCWLAFKHTINLVAILYHHYVAIVYLPICQTIIGIIRDGVFMFLAKKKKAKVIIHLHGGYFRELYARSPFFGKRIIEKACSFVERAIVIGDSFKHIFKNLITDSRITVVSNAIDRNYITDDEVIKAEHLRSERKWKNEVVTILYLSNLISTKGYYDVIKAIPEIIKTHNKVKFIFAGEFDNRKNRRLAEIYINQHDINPYVDFVGTITGDNKKKKLLSSDIYILPTYYPGEGQPVSILEAMAAGMPIVSTNHGCIKEMISDGENGFIVEKRNPIHIANAINLLLNSFEMRAAMGRKNRALFLQHYTVERLVESLLGIFGKALTCVRSENETY